MSYDTAPGISIHAAREGGDMSLQSLALSTALFQSTPPVKAATYANSVTAVGLDDFNPRRP